MVEKTIQDVVEKPVKKERKKKEISPERKAQLLEQLKKAREKAAANRKAKKEAKVAATKEPVAPPEPKTKKPRAPRKPKKDAKDLELERLREQVKTFTLQDIARKSKPAPKVKSAAIEDSEDELIDEIIVPDVERPPSPVSLVKAEPIQVPPEAPSPVQEKPPPVSRPQIVEQMPSPVQSPAPKKVFAPSVPQKVKTSLYKKKRRR